MDPLIGGALIKGGASILGNILGFGSTSDTNQTNLKIARETNEANLALAKQQNDWNVDMWNRTNEYNTIENQLDRWRSAGLNPNSFAPDGSSAQPLQSVDMANQQQPSTGQQPFKPDTESLGNAFMDSQVAKADRDAKLQQAKAAEENAKTAQLQALMQREMMPWQQSALDAQARLGYVNATNEQLMLPYQMDAQRAYTLFHRSSADQAKASAWLMGIQAENAYREGQWIDKKNNALVHQMNSQSFANLMAGKLSSANVGVAVQTAQKVWSDKNLNNWNAKLKRLEFDLMQKGINPSSQTWLSSLLQFVGRNADSFDLGFGDSIDGYTGPAVINP